MEMFLSKLRMVIGTPKHVEQANYFLEGLVYDLISISVLLPDQKTADFVEKTTVNLQHIRQVCLQYNVSAGIRNFSVH